MSIYLYQVQEAIEKLEKSGIDVIKDDYVIYAGKFTEFEEDLYPLPIILVADEQMPDNVAFMATKRVES